MSPSPRIVTTGLAWTGFNSRSVLSMLRDVINMATNEIQLAVYSITDGAKELLNLIHNALIEGLRVTMVVNDLNSQDKRITKSLLKMTSFSNFHLLSFEGINESLHAKVIVVDRKIAIIGSANFTKGGMITNHELGVVVYDKPAETCSNLIDILCKDHRTKVVTSSD